MEGMKRPNPGNNSPGAYAEYIMVRPDMVRKLPDSVSDKEAALTEPAAVALHAVRQAKVGLGDRVLITGGGPIGLLCAVWARLSSASCVVLTEVDSFRRTFAMEMGDADEAFDAADPDLRRKIKKASDGGFNIAIETSASDAGIHTAMSVLKPHGRMVLAGINFKSQPVSTLLHTIKELKVIGSFGYFPEEFDLTIRFLAEKRLGIEKMVTRVISFEDLQEVFHEMDLKAAKDIKIIIKP
jgi:threonine dehydrogenase-like Zn-dependent dehydrogenase